MRASLLLSVQLWWDLDPFVLCYPPKLISSPLMMCVGEQFPASDTRRGAWQQLASPPPFPPPLSLSSCKHLHPSCIVSNRKIIN